MPLYPFCCQNPHHPFLLSLQFYSLIFCPLITTPQPGFHHPPLSSDLKPYSPVVCIQMDIHSHQPVFSPKINLRFPACTVPMTAALGEAAELTSLPLHVAFPTSSASHYTERHQEPAQQTRKSHCHRTFGNKCSWTNTVSKLWLVPIHYCISSPKFQVDFPIKRLTPSGDWVRRIRVASIRVGHRDFSIFFDQFF